MHGAGNKSLTDIDMDSDPGNLTDEEQQGVNDITEAEVRRQGQIDISDALTDGQQATRTNGSSMPNA